MSKVWLNTKRVDYTFDFTEAIFVMDVWTYTMLLCFWQNLSFMMFINRNIQWKYMINN